METVEQRQAARQVFAAELNAKVEEARRMLGPATAYGKWTLRDTTGQAADQVVYCCRHPGMVGWQPNAEEAFGDRLTERTGQVILIAKGIEYCALRFQLWFGTIEGYHPMAPEALAKRNATVKANRAKKRAERDRAAMPLFADQITDE